MPNTELNMEVRELREFEKKLGYKFKNTSLVEEALRHRSFVNESGIEGMRDNERFEFLGDAVLNLVIGHVFMIRYPDLNEGDLSKLRAGLVNESSLASISAKLDIGSRIKLSKGEIQTNGRHKKSILADTLEAIFAAVYLDSSFQSAFEVISSLFSTEIDSAVEESITCDYKTKFQELVQPATKKTPVYTVIDENGPDHDKTFSVQLEFQDISTIGFGKNKKSAEQNAAKAAVAIIEENNNIQ